MESHGKRYEIHGLEHKDMPVIFWAGGHGTVPNWHENIEMLYCTKGKGQLFCGGEEYLMVPGHIYVINASELHSAFDLGQLNYYCLIVDANFLSQNSLKTVGLELETDVDSGEVIAIYQSIIREMEMPGPFHAALIRSLCLNLMVQLLRRHSRRSSERENRMQSSDENIKRSVEYIETNYSKKLTLEQIAEEAGFSKYYFARQFKKVTGMTVVGYLNLIRCTKAKKLLEQGQCSVLQVANRCGFENASYFSKTFRQVMGMLPSDVENNP